MRADVQRFYGLNLDDVGEAYSWRHLADLAACLPHESATIRELSPANLWGPQEYLLASIADSLRWLVWAKTRDGSRGRNMPKPIPRPGDVNRSQGRFKDAVALPLDEVKRLLRLPRGEGV